MSPQKVPFIDLLRLEPGFREEAEAKVLKALREGHFVMGPEVSEFEGQLKSYTGAQALALCANGTDAIQLALRAAGVRAGDRVLLPDMTFWASFEAIVNVGAKPVPCDVELETLHLSLATIEQAIERFKPRALMVVHLYGWAMPEIKKVRELCLRQNIILIEDSAQAIGTRLDGASLIGTAPVATTSFYPAKVLGASGDAGAVFSHDPAISALAAKLANHGRLSHYEHGWIGWNSRPGVYESVYLSAGIKHLDARIASRRKVLDLYRKELAGLPLRLLKPADGVFENGYLSVGRVDDPALREKLRAHLTEQGIGSGTVYPGAMTRQPGARGFFEESIDHGHADLVARTVLNLPCFAYMTDGEISRVVDVVRGFFKRLA
jgi:UDP-2-acetamido-2-deoxy-ribo-hexuluronate aminotransferase